MSRETKKKPRLWKK